MSGSLLSARSLCLKKKGTPVLDQVSLDIRAGEITTLIGPNGAGKSSLVRTLLALELPTSGEIHRLPELRIGYVPQDIHVPRALPLRVIDFLSSPVKKPVERILRVLQDMDVADLVDEAMQSISGGELQRVLLARALLVEPQLLVLDEPAQGLDVIGQQALYRTITSIRDSHDCAILMVSHDLHLVMASTDNVICLNSHVCCTGHPDDVSSHPEYIKLFGTALDGLAVYSHHHDHEHDVHGNIIHEGHEHGDHSGCRHD